ncbi:MAG: DNA-protecting protein DprA, partial [Desulfuromonas sp.]
MDKTEQELLKLHLTPGLGHTALFKLHAFFNDFSLAAKASAREWRTAGVAEKLHAGIPDGNAAGYREICRLIDSRQIRLISFWDQRYPPLLREIHDPPALLYLRGELPRQECFAIVGSRRATTTGLLATRELAKNLALHDICVVSGLARGIDSAAHFGALDASGKTIAVLGCGIDQIYPRENTPLAERIKDNGALISEYPPGTPPLAGHFPGRNRIISGLSHGV